MSKLRIVVVTSCTGEKAVESADQLTLVDFKQSPAHVAKREAKLAAQMMPAEAMYTGMQHRRLMRGVQIARTNLDLEVDLNIVSAGYGLVPGDRNLAPYEATFIGLKKSEARAWAQKLNLARHVRDLVARPYELGLVLLGDDYLDALALDDSVKLGGPTLLFCGKASAARLPDLKQLQPVVLANEDATRFACGMVGIKGELASRILLRLARDPGQLSGILAAKAQVLDHLATATPAAASSSKSGRESIRVNPAVDNVIDIPQTWWDKSHRQNLRYFIPEWDDLVDPEFDFVQESHSGGSADWGNEVYAHQMYPEPNYDGILVSREVVKKKKKRERVEQLGIHRFLRVPRNFPVMGDCGAFGYITQEVPPYSTDDVLDYYTRNDFDFGVSVDHLILAGTADSKQERYQLTIQNAEEFLREHRRLGLTWEPIGAVQGWDPKTYADAARRYVAMGYKFIALGGLVRTNTQGIIETLEAVQKVVPATMKIHLFGIARLAGMHEFIKYGATSIDNASMLRKAWLGSDLNYLTEDGWYSAIRIPEAKTPDARGGSFRAKSLVTSGAITFVELKKLEQSCLNELRAYARSRGSVPSSLLDHLVSYDELVAGQRKRTRERLYRTLSERPWERCPCAICQRWGVEVLVFRGNNRNRRRGFHNTYVFYRLLQKMIAGESVPLVGESDEDTQISLFGNPETVT